MTSKPFGGFQLDSKKTLTAFLRVELSTTVGAGKGTSVAAAAANVGDAGDDGLPLLTMSALPETIALPSAVETSPSKPFW